jgi:hypothetical protein
MTPEQAAELIEYMNALNVLLLRLVNYAMFSAVVLALAGGMYIGWRWGSK